jgi:hypothetical protein
MAGLSCVRAGSVGSAVGTCLGIYLCGIYLGNLSGGFIWGSDNPVLFLWRASENGCRFSLGKREVSFCGCCRIADPSCIRDRKCVYEDEWVNAGNSG